MIYVLEGTATLVTGGAVVEPKVTEPAQVRGPVIQGGVARHLAKGDVMVIPEGTPHWFQEVEPITANGLGK